MNNILSELEYEDFIMDILAHENGYVKRECKKHYNHRS